MFARAARKSGKDLEHARTRLDRLAFLRSPQMQALLALPNQLQSLHNSVASLPEIDPSSAALEPGILPEPGKRPWETSKTGYLNWAVDQLMQRAKEKAKDESGEGAAFAEGSSAVGATAAAAYDIGRAEHVKAMLERVAGEGAVVSVETGKGKVVDRMDSTPG